MSSAKKKKERRHEAQQKKIPAPEKVRSPLERPLALMVAIIALIQYIQTINYDFALDDYSAIIENNITRSGIKAIPTIFETTYRFGYPIQGDELYRPLPKSIFAVFWQLFPENPLPLHLLNILLYAFTGWLIFIVFSRFIPWNIYVPFMASLLFVAHPIHTEVVANIKSLDEILGLLFFITSLFFLQRFFSERKKRWLLFTGVCYFASLISKESAITYLAVYLLVIYFFTSQAAGMNFRVSGFMLIPAIIFLIIRFRIVEEGGAVSAADNALMATRDVITQKSSAIYILGIYLKLLFFPHPLTFDYSLKQIPLARPGDWQFIVSFLVHLALLAFALVRMRKKDLISFGILFYFITISISSNVFFTIGTHMAERLLYVPSFGFCFAVAASLDRLFHKTAVPFSGLKEFFMKRLPVLSIMVIIVFLYSIKSWSQNGVWRNNETLYESGILGSPGSFRTHYYLGLLLTKKEHYTKFPEAEQGAIAARGLAELRKAIDIYPGFSDAWLHIGNYYHGAGKSDSAMYYFQKAIALDPHLSVPHNNLGTIYFEMEQWDKAIAEFTMAIQYDPNYHDAYKNLGSAYGTVGKFREAIPWFQKALQLAPDNAETNYFLGITYRSLGDQQNAAIYLNKAAALDPKFSGQ